MRTNETLSQRLARNLDLIRSARQMRSGEFIQHIGLTRQAVSNWRSARSNASLETLHQIGERLDMEPSALLERDPSDVLRRLS